jgi:hypothetical protein
MYYSLYTSSDYFNNHSYEENKDIDINQFEVEEDGTNKICLICWLPPQKNNLIKKLQDIPYIITICNCNPEFHDNCLTDWIYKTSSCPICRKKIKINSHTHLSNKYKKGITYFIIIFNVTTNFFRIATLVSLCNILCMCIYDIYLIYYFKNEFEYSYY